MFVYFDNTEKNTCCFGYPAQFGMISFLAGEVAEFAGRLRRALVEADK